MATEDLSQRLREALFEAHKYGRVEQRAIDRGRAYEPYEIRVAEVIAALLDLAEASSRAPSDKQLREALELTWNDGFAMPIEVEIPDGVRRDAVERAMVLLGAPAPAPDPPTGYIWLALRPRDLRALEEGEVTVHASSQATRKLRELDGEEGS